MKLIGTLAAAAVAVGMMVAPASATTFIFKSGGAFLDTPDGNANVEMNCGTVGNDLCTIDDAAGFTYSKDGVSVNVVALANNVATQLIQDLVPNNSGLGVLSEDDAQQDQAQFDSAEALVFVFNAAVNLTDIEFNAGDDVDCSAASSEGPCGAFDLFIDDVFFANIAAVDLLTDTFFGTKFSFVPTTMGGGFTIAQFTVSDVPIPGAIPLLLSGLAGLGFASRRKKAA